MNELVVFRTHYCNERVLAQIDHLRAWSGRDVLICLDDRKLGKDLPPHIEWVALNDKSNGLFKPSDLGWRCGDYCFYRAFEHLPNYEYYWLIEYDVRIHSNRTRDLFDGFTESTRTADFITPWYIESSPEWAWYNTISPFSKKVFNCMLQLCRLSKKAVRQCLEARLRHTDLFMKTARPANLWPNDEALIGSTLYEYNLDVALLSKHAPMFSTGETFSFTRPTLLSWLERQPKDNRIYHPVNSGERFAERAFAYAQECVIEGASDSKIASWLHQASLLIGEELGTDRAKAFDLKVSRMWKGDMHG